MGVRMTHPDLEQEIAVAASAVPFHRAAGWQVVEGQDDQGEQWPAELQPFEGQPVVRLRHPDLDTEISVAASAVPIHRSNGWLVVDEQAEAAADLEAKTVPELRDLAKDQGVKPVPTTKPALLAALRGEEAEQQDESPAPPASEEGE